MKAHDPEMWLRGALPDVAPELMPVAHSLLQVREELETNVSRLVSADLYARPGGAASIAFHVRHIAGSVDRLFTYARGEALSSEQLKAIALEAADHEWSDAAEAVSFAQHAIDRALDQVRATPVDALHEPRRVGREGLPSTVLGLLFHAAEHAQRHSGQIATTAKLLGVSTRSSADRED